MGSFSVGRGLGRSGSAEEAGGLLGDGGRFCVSRNAFHPPKRTPHAGPVHPLTIERTLLEQPSTPPTHTAWAMECWDELCMHAAADTWSVASASAHAVDAFDLHDSDDQAAGPVPVLTAVDAFDLCDSDTENTGQALGCEAPALATAASTWNQWVAHRKGDQFADTPAQCSGKSSEWTLDATMRSAFTFHRRGPFGTDAVQTTRLNHSNTVSAKALVALAGMEAQSAGLTEVLRVAQQPSQDNQYKGWVAIGRKWDGTRVAVQFPKELSATFTTWLLARLARASGLTAEQKERLAHAAKHRRVGTMEVLVQSAWLHSHILPQSEQCCCPPRFLQRTTASNVRAALDTTTPQFSTASLAQMAARLGFAWSVVTMDSAASNIRCFQEMADDLPSNVFHVMLRCQWHQITRPVSVMLDDHGVLSPLFSLSCLLRQSEYFYMLVSAVFELVHEELEVYYPPQAPRPEWALYNRSMIQNTVLRVVERTRARSHPSHTQPPPPSCFEKALRPVAEKFATYVNGNLASPRIQHFCNGQCCPTRTRQESVERVVDAVLAPLIELMPPRPAGNKHGSVAANVSHASFGFEAHSILSRAFSRRWGTVAREADNQVPEGSWP